MSEELLYGIEYCNGVKVGIDFDSEFASAVRLDLPFVDGEIKTRELTDNLERYKKDAWGELDNPHDQARRIKREIDERGSNGRRRDYIR